MTKQQQFTRDSLIVSRIHQGHPQYCYTTCNCIFCVEHTKRLAAELANSQHKARFL